MSERKNIADNKGFGEDSGSSNYCVFSL